MSTIQAATYVAFTLGVQYLVFIVTRAAVRNKAFWDGYDTGRDAQWVEDSMALQRELAARRDRSGKFKPARGPLVLPPRSKE